MKRIGEGQVPIMTYPPLPASGRTTPVPLRLPKVRTDRPWASNLDIAALNAVGSAGFHPVGQVLGVTVFQLGYSGSWRCGGFSLSRPVGAGVESTPLVNALYKARRLALDRLLDEAIVLGADGVVGVDLQLEPFPETPDAVEFRASGTAVRAEGQVRAPLPFLSHLSGQDFAALLHNGWVPTGIATGISVLVRHDDSASVQQAGSFGNTEVAGYTALVEATRLSARKALARDVTRTRGDGVVVRSMSLHISEQPCGGGPGGSGVRDHLAEAVIMGTAITRFRRTTTEPDTPPTLSILRLR